MSKMGPVEKYLLIQEDLRKARETITQSIKKDNPKKKPIRRKQNGGK